MSLVAQPSRWQGRFVGDGSEPKPVAAGPRRMGGLLRLKSNIRRASVLRLKRAEPDYQPNFAVILFAPRCEKHREAQLWRGL